MASLPPIPASWRAALEPETEEPYYAALAKFVASERREHVVCPPEEDVFAALGLRNGELLVGVADVIKSRAWPRDGASIADWIAALSAVGNDLEAPARRIEPVIGDVLTALGESKGARLAPMSGSGATCFALFATAGDAQAAAKKISAEQPTWWVHAGELS